VGRFQAPRGRPFSAGNPAGPLAGSSQVQWLKPLFEASILPSITRVSVHQIPELPSRPPDSPPAAKSHLDQRSGCWDPAKRTGSQPQVRSERGRRGGDVSGGSHCRQATAGASRSTGPMNIPAGAPLLCRMGTESAPSCTKVGGGASDLVAQDLAGAVPRQFIHEDDVAGNLVPSQMGLHVIANVGLRH
jgi:hypothetical protein